jgi:pilus assembly protein Flp/PilA
LALNISKKLKTQGYDFAGRCRRVGGMRQKLTAFLKNESGATAIEYGLIASGIALALIAVVKGVGTNVKTVFGSVSTAVK